jgi:hypothetical protein
MQKDRVASNLTFLIATAILVPANDASAAEGAASHYLAGTAGDILMAQSPKPGLQVATTLYYQSGDVGAAVLQGKVGASLDVDIFLTMPAASYTFEQPVLGAIYSVVAAIPFGYANLDVGLTGPRGNSFSTSADSFDISDIMVVPLQLNWSFGKFSFEFAEGVIAPTGEYDVNNLVNLGRNYWSFDTVASMTWFNPGSGTDISVAPGIMFNTENNKTNYKTGSEFHVEFVVNQFLTETFSIGLRGYYYDQITGDSGSGAVLGDFKSESLAIGPGFVWIPKAGAGDLVILGKWMSDLYAEKRFESDYFTLGVAWKF